MAWGQQMPHRLRGEGFREQKACIECKGHTQRGTCGLQALGAKVGAGDNEERRLHGFQRQAEVDSALAGRENLSKPGQILNHRMRCGVLQED